MKVVKLAALGMLAALSLVAQTAPEPARPVVAQRVDVDTPGGALLNFRPRGKTTVELRGAGRLRTASASARVEGKEGYIEIEIKGDDVRALPSAGTFGSDFLTYVVWVVPVNGAAANAGELAVGEGGIEDLKVTTSYRTFWLLVTAEPHFAVQNPSAEMVLVSQSQAQTRTGNKAHEVPGELFYYTHYTDYETTPSQGVSGAPRELQQARKAAELAERAGVPTDTIAPPAEMLRQAQGFLREAEAELQRGGDSQQLVWYARAATQLAENARALTVGAVGGLVAQRLHQELQQVRSQYSQAQERLAQTQSELTRLKDSFSQLEASLDGERRRTRELEGQLLALRERVSLAEGMLEGNREQTARLERERHSICDELRRQLAALGHLAQEGNQLALSLASDLLFDSNSYQLRPASRESLAKLAALRATLFPQVAVRYEGHTDLVGEEEYNQWLSEQRALAVYQYFLQEEISRKPSEDEVAWLQQRLQVVERLLDMNYNTARRERTRRQQWLAELGSAVVGKGMREPQVPERGPNAQNRRVTLVFAESTLGGLTSVCLAPEPAPQG